MCGCVVVLLWVGVGVGVSVGVWVRGAGCIVKLGLLLFTTGSLVWHSALTHSQRHLSSLNRISIDTNLLSRTHVSYLPHSTHPPIVIPWGNFEVYSNKTFLLAIKAILFFLWNKVQFLCRWYPHWSGGTSHCPGALSLQ